MKFSELEIGEHFELAELANVKFIKFDEITVFDERLNAYNYNLDKSVYIEPNEDVIK